MADDERQVAAAYVGSTTFFTSLNQLANAVVPNRIDRTAFPGFAGGVQSQILSAYRFLGLINGDSKPTPALHALAVKDEAARKVALAKILRERYSALFALDLLKVTPGELSEAMAGEYGVGGETKEKAVRFFLSAATYAGIAVSPLLAKVKGPTGPGGPRKRRQQPRPKLVSSDADIEEDLDPEAGEFVVIRLQSGGTLKLSASTRFFELERSDRDFVFALLDKLREYERATTSGKLSD